MIKETNISEAGKSLIKVAIYMIVSTTCTIMNSLGFIYGDDYPGWVFYTILILAIILTLMMMFELLKAGQLLHDSTKSPEQSKDLADFHSKMEREKMEFQSKLKASSRGNSSDNL